MVIISSFQLTIVTVPFKASSTINDSPVTVRVLRIHHRRTTARAGSSADRHATSFSHTPGIAGLRCEYDDYATSYMLYVSLLNVSVEFLSSLQGSSQCSGLFSVGSHILCCPCQQLEVWTLEFHLNLWKCWPKALLWVPFHNNYTHSKSIHVPKLLSLPAVDHGLIDISWTTRGRREAVT